MITLGLLIGLTTGILSGLLGIAGNGILIVLAVTFMGITQHSAQATAMAASIPIALIGAINLHRKKLVNYPVAFFLAIGFIFGGLFGSYIANMISGEILKKVFSIFFGIMSIQMYWTARK